MITIYDFWACGSTFGRVSLCHGPKLEVHIDHEKYVFSIHKAAHKLYDVLVPQVYTTACSLPYLV